MKTQLSYFRLALLALMPLLSQCTATRPKATEAASLAATTVKDKPAKSAKELPPAKDDLDDYAVVEISDPIEGFNRATFWLNDKLYLIVFRPISKGYEKVMPKPLRKGVYNAFENVKFPVRFVNHALQGKFKNAGLETEKFLINTVAGIGGLIRVSDKVPVLAELPDQDTGKTFAKWGMGHGAYIVLPFLGPSSARDGVALVGDYAMNPVNWGLFWGGDHDWTQIPPAANTLRALPGQLSTYDSAKRDSIDPYIAIRSAYVQYRAEAVKK
ncbi:MAG: MlaA family lipoprotein [Verrucomicrobiaceae bacterium]